MVEKRYCVIAGYGYPKELPDKVFEVEAIIQDDEGNILDTKRWMLEDGKDMDSITDEIMFFGYGIKTFIQISELLELEKEKCPDCNNQRTHRFMTREQLSAQGYL